MRALAGLTGADDCPVPIDQTSIKTLYVFVEIGIDRRHLAETVRYNFPRALGPSRQSAPIAIESDQPVAGPSKTRLACVGTVQFIAAVQGLQDDLDELEADVPRRLALMPGPSSETAVPVDEPPDTTRHTLEIVVPQIKPLSPGEVLGCTAPKLSDDIDGLLCVRPTLTSLTRQIRRRRALPPRVDHDRQSATAGFSLRSVREAHHGRGLCAR